MPEFRTGGAARVVVVGGGQAGLQVCDSLRAAGHDGPVTLVCAEPVLPYERPPLSKTFLHGDVDVSLRTAGFYAGRNITVRHSAVRRIDRPAGAVVLSDGDTLRYDALVLATGAAPRRLGVPGAESSRVLRLRTVADAARLRDELVAGRRLVIAGGGLVGLEVASAARRLGCAVTVVERAPRLLRRTVSPEVSRHLALVHRGRGTALLLGRQVRAVDDSAGRLGVRLDDGTRLTADVLLEAVGAVPGTALAAAAGLATGDGVLVDAYLRTSDPRIFAIGDCAWWPDARSGRRVTTQSVQNATDQARCVAATINGRPEPYEALPWFFSALGEVTVQIAGLAGDDDARVVLGDPATGRFSVCRFRDGRLCAVESVNRQADHVIARRLLTTGPAPDLDQARRPGFDLRKALAGQPATAGTAAR